ncbi:MAG TPA: 3'(2'),5'-bisphosphate nucleotidase CysQ [Stellaceae bacterium]|nr:3'(2'),5'-bisphosphate nucleotidase CysQ [Stellaceae bacterium]
MAEYDELLELIERAAWKAGDAILEIYETDFDVARKSDRSPVTQADAAAEAIIIEHLRLVGTTVIAEELAEREGLPEVAPDRFWLVDPLDGTKEFIKKNGEFTVNIALVEHGVPVLGVVGIPAKGLIYAASGPGTAHKKHRDGATRPIAARSCPEAGATIAYSRSHADMAELEAFLGSRRVADRIVAGSALKFCLVAEGVADLYPRLGPTMEWDTAAGQAVLEAAGGRVETLDGKPFRYGKPGFRNTGFVALGRG